MSLLKTLLQPFNADNLREQYLIGYEVELNGDEDCTAFIDTQCVSKQIAKTYFSYIYLKYKDGVLIQGNLFSDGEEETDGDTLESLKIKGAIGRLKYRDVGPNQVYAFVPMPSGVHQLGGLPPAEFKMPEHNCAAPFQYLGFISNIDNAYNWLPFTVQLICPVYLNMDKVFLDYADPTAPVIINKAEVESYHCQFKELNRHSRMEFEAMPFKTIPAKKVDGPLGHAGVPAFIQQPVIPRCPKSGRVMKFLCQLKSNTGVKTAYSNVVPAHDYNKAGFAEMNFWGNGDLYVFFEPEAKTACYFIQHT